MASLDAGNALHPLRIATRKSALAVAQTTLAAEAIVKACASAPGGGPLKYELVTMTTEGDRRLDKSLASFGGKGVFIKELEVALLEGRADIAVHSLKDMPAQVLPEFKIAAVLKREDPRDAFVARGGAEGVKFMDLPAGARVGTGSIRRVVQLKALRPDIEYVPIRGNIQTRLSKLDELDGVVLAAAGLRRMGLSSQVTEYFDTDKVLPASGQGILAIETLCDDSRYGGARPKQLLTDILARVNDRETYAVAVAEMAYLKALDAGCQFPVASFAEIVPPVEKGEIANDSQIQMGQPALKICGIYWDEKSERMLRAEHIAQIGRICGVETSDAFENAVKAARAAGVALASKIREQFIV